MKNSAVVYASSNEYFEITFASIISLINHNPNLNIVLYLLSDNVSQENILRLESFLATSQISLSVIEINKYLDGLKSLNSVGGSFTTYGRLFIADICKEKKALYIDSDTYINGSISEIFNIDLEGKVLGGVQDCIESIYYKIFGLDKYKYRYINAGILLIDVEKWKNRKISDRVAQYLKEHTVIPNYDQGVINDLFRDEIYLLELKYNMLPQIFYFKDAKKIQRLCGLKVFYSDDQVKIALSNPIIIHFTGSGSTPYRRPWVNGAGVEHPYASHFLVNYSGAMSERQIDFNLKKHKFFSKLPFCYYCAFEKILNIRRNIIVSRDSD